MTDHPHDREDAWRGVVSSPLDIVGMQPLSSVVGLEVGAVSSCGAAQPCNTDHYLVIRLGRVQETMLTSLAAADLPPRFEESSFALLVADGLGGASGGARASRLALGTLAHLAIEYGEWNVRVRSDTRAEIVRQGEFLYRQVNEAVRHARESDLRLAQMATSLTAVYITGAELFFAHVGHSKAFLFRNGTLTQLTRDDGGAAHDQPPAVTETIGGSPFGPDVSIEHTYLVTGDRVLLCTNGLTDVVSGNAIADILSTRRCPADECAQLVDCAVAAGAPDNVTALVADYGIRQPPVIVQSGNGG
jgi:protein phosphatase